MKKIVVMSSLILILVSLSVFAQQRFTPQERVKMLKERLNLSDEQSIKVEKILLKSNEDLKKLRGSNNQDRSEFIKIRENSDQEILKVLNDKQKIEFKKMLEERKNRSGDMRGGRKNGQQ